MKGRNLLRQAQRALDDGLPERAVALATEVLARHPDSADAYEIRALAHEEAGDEGAAIGDYDRAIALRPAGELHHNRAYAHLKLGHHEAAARDLLAAIEALGDDVDLWLDRADCLVELGRVEEATVELEAAAERLSGDGGDELRDHAAALRANNRGTMRG